MVEATCHCGNVHIETAELPTLIVSCNCSVCFRMGALWGYYSAADVDVHHETAPTDSYRWGDEKIAFHHCPDCGCVTHYTSTEKAENKRTVINFRMVDRHITEKIPLRKFDGADTWQFIEE